MTILGDTWRILQLSRPTLQSRAIFPLLPAMGHHRKDVDDAARLATLDQVSDHALHQQERAARIGIELTLPELEAGVEQRAAVSERGRVHESIHVPKALQSCLYESVAVICG
jgi:hypothetical protein